jgi:hypothetical protein
MRSCVQASVRAAFFCGVALTLMIAIAGSLPIWPESLTVYFPDAPFLTAGDLPPTASSSPARRNAALAARLKDLSAAYVAPTASVQIAAAAPDDDVPQCRDFFTIFAYAFIPEDTPVYPQKVMRDHLDYLSAQLVRFNRTLTVYVTRPPAPGLPQFPNVHFELFDPLALLQRCGMADVHLAEMRRWALDPNRKMTIPRESDVLRLCVARERRATYMDFDIVMLDATPLRYQENFVSFGNWRETGGALEPTNDFFCLSSSQVDLVLGHVRRSMEEKARNPQLGYAYTELGPVAFMRMLLIDQQRIPILNEQHPWGHTAAAIVANGCDYRISHLHLTTAIRRRFEKRMIGMGGVKRRYVHLLQYLRCRLGAPPLDVGNVTALRDPLACHCEPSARALLLQDDVKVVTKPLHTHAPFVAACFGGALVMALVLKLSATVPADG